MAHSPFRQDRAPLPPKSWLPNPESADAAADAEEPRRRKFVEPKAGAPDAEEADEDDRPRANRHGPKRKGFLRLAAHQIGGRYRQLRRSVCFR